jgi:hypothetical protein
MRNVYWFIGFAIVIFIIIVATRPNNSSNARPTGTSLEDGLINKRVFTKKTSEETPKYITPPTTALFRMAGVARPSDGAAGLQVTGALRGLHTVQFLPSQKLILVASILRNYKEA